MNPMIFFGYIRVSTKRQDLSIDAQTEAVQRAADYHAGGTAHFELFTEPDTSGSTEFARRDQGARLLADAAKYLKEGRAVTVIVPKVDRLGRDVVDINQTVRRFEQMGIRVLFLDINVDTRTAMGRAFMQIAAVFAELELARIRERIQATIDHKFDRRQVCGETPFGWTTRETGEITPKGVRIRELVDNPEEQRWILHMAGLCQRGATGHAIARDLKSRSVPTKKGGLWTATRIEKLLGSKTVRAWLATQSPQSPTTL